MFKRKKTAKSHRFYRKRSKRKKSFNLLDLGIAFFGVLTILFVLSSVRRLTQTQAEGSLRITPLRLQVLNATGSELDTEVMKLLEEMNLGKYYFEVVEQENFSDSPIKETLLLDRGGEKKLTRLVGEKLGLKRENIISQELENNYLNISYTLILGQDYQEFLKQKD